MELLTALFVAAAAWAFWRYFAHADAPAVAPAVAPLSGDGSYSLNVVGESFYEQSFQTICGRRSGTQHVLNASAKLALDDMNKFDSKAVAVYINDLQVGHLSKEDARTFRRVIASKHPSGAREFSCHAQVYCGGPELVYSVSLDLVLN